MKIRKSWANNVCFSKKDKSIFSDYNHELLPVVPALIDNDRLYQANFLVVRAMRKKKLIEYVCFVVEEELPLVTRNKLFIKACLKNAKEYLKNPNDTLTNQAYWFGQVASKISCDIDSIAVKSDSYDDALQGYINAGGLGSASSLSYLIYVDKYFCGYAADCLDDDLHLSFLLKKAKVPAATLKAIEQFKKIKIKGIKKGLEIITRAKASTTIKKEIPDHG